MKTSKDYTLEFRNYGTITVPAGTALTHRTAMGIDLDYHFVADYGWIADNYKSIDRVLLHDVQYYGINVPVEYVDYEHEYIKDASIPQVTFRDITLLCTNPKDVELCNQVLETMRTNNYERYETIFSFGIYKNYTFFTSCLHEEADKFILSVNGHDFPSEEAVCEYIDYTVLGTVEVVPYIAPQFTYEQKNVEDDSDDCICVVLDPDGMNFTGEYHTLPEAIAICNRENAKLNGEGETKASPVAPENLQRIESLKLAIDNRQQQYDTSTGRKAYSIGEYLRRMKGELAFLDANSDIDHKYVKNVAPVIARAWAVQYGSDCDGVPCTDVKAYATIAEAVFFSKSAEAYDEGTYYQATSNWQDVLEYCSSYGIDADKLNYVN